MKPIKYKVCREEDEPITHKMGGKTLLDFPGLLRWARERVAKMGRPEDHNQSIKDVEVTDETAV